MGCDLDWTVRGDPGPGDSASSPDGPSDGAAGEAAADGGGVDGGDVDANTSDAADCDALAADVARTRDLSRACQLASGHCTSAVRDECGCDVVVRAAGSAETLAYESAIDAYSASCTPTCVGCTTVTLPGICLQRPDIRLRCSP